MKEQKKKNLPLRVTETVWCHAQNGCTYVIFPSLTWRLFRCDTRQSEARSEATRNTATNWSEAVNEAARVLTTIQEQLNKLNDVRHILPYEVYHNFLTHGNKTCVVLAFFMSLLFSCFYKHLSYQSSLTTSPDRQLPFLDSHLRPLTVNYLLYWLSCIYTSPTMADAVMLQETRGRWVVLPQVYTGGKYAEIRVRLIRIWSLHVVISSCTYAWRSE